MVVEDMQIKEGVFGHLSGRSAKYFELRNKNGMLVKVTNYGGTITEIHVPDKDGNIEDVILGFDSLEPYLKDHPYFGSTIGRSANRIAKGKFQIGNNVYQVEKNLGEHHLHGGSEGFHSKLWESKIIKDGVEFYYLSKDGEGNYPGNLKVCVRFSLSHDNQLRIEYKAETDQSTICNLTNHSYFNLAGESSTTILDHDLQIFASHYNETDAALIPTGKLLNVENTPLDFRTTRLINDRIDEEHDTIRFGNGYDHNFILDKHKNELALAAILKDSKSGRVMEVLTTEPGLQLYTGNSLDNRIGKSGRPYNKRSAVCLETQHFPDAPNQVSFPSTQLNPGDIYQSTTIYHFKVQHF